MEHATDSVFRVKTCWVQHWKNGAEDEFVDTEVCVEIMIFLRAYPAMVQTAFCGFARFVTVRWLRTNIGEAVNRKRRKQ